MATHGRNTIDRVALGLSQNSDVTRGADATIDDRISVTGSLKPLYVIKSSRRCDGDVRSEKDRYGPQ